MGSRRVGHDFAWTKASQGEVDGLHDTLTGLPNRAALRKAAAEMFREHIKTGRSAALAVIDLDHFKGFNTEFGHDGGDAALVAASATFRDRVRRGRDLVFRWGGEEFAVLLPDTSATEALDVMNRVRLEVSCMPPIAYRAKAGGQKRIVDRAVTISVGIAMLTRENSNLDDLFVVADEALSRAKDEGRNRVRIAEQDQVDPSASLPRQPLLNRIGVLKGS